MPCWIPAFPTSQRSTAGHRVPRLPAAGRVARAGGAGEARRVPRRDLLGPSGARASARSTRRSRSSASRPPRTAPTAPAACSPATAPATSSTPRCTRVGLASQPTATPRRRRPGAVRRPDHRAGALRAAREQADPGRARHLPAAGSRGSSRCCGRRCGRSWCSAGSAGRRCCPCWPTPGWTVPRPRPKFGHGVEVELGRARRPAAPARLLPRQPAEHLHRPADPGDARGRAARAKELAELG